MATLLHLTRGRFLNLALTLLSCFFLVTTGLGQTVTSDKDDYAPGEVAIITGTGWVNDQYVDVHFEETPAFHEEHQHDYHGIAVDANGNWEIRYQIETRHLGVAFDVHVIGKQSGAEAYTYFTDANVEFYSSGLPSGTPVTIKYRINSTSGSQTTLSFNAPGPSTAVAVSGSQTIYYSFNEIIINGIKHTAPEGSQLGTDNNGKIKITAAYTAICTTPSTPTISAAQSTTVCPGGTVVLSSSYTNGNQWYKGGVAISSANNQTYSASESGSYTVIVTSNGCSSTASAPITVTVEDKTAPVAPVLADVTGECSATATAPTTTDHCAGTITGTTSDAVTYNTQGTHVITWSFNDGNGNISTAKQNVFVKDVTAPSITAPNAVTAIANFECTATGVALGIPTTSDNCSIASVTNDAPAAFPIGNTTVTWTVKDAVGLSTTAIQVVTVTNTAPSDIAIIGPVDPIQLNNSGTLRATFVDNNIKSAIWDWKGLGTESGKTITASTATATYTYNQAGVYIVTLTLEDHCGLKTTKDFEYVVIIDPNGGFVTGGGWIESKAGALVADATAAGKANFGFVSKYKKGSNPVDGNTEFQFKAGNLNFKSQLHNAGSLVIAGAKAIYKGEGTVNGTGNYGFMVSAIDGQVSGGGGTDKFRIKIWDKNNGDALVYDNQNGAADNADATTVIGGGSIVIHEVKTNNKTAEAPQSPTVEKGTIELTPEVKMDILGNLAVAPNPVRTETKVRFTLIEDAGVTVRLYDFNGREIYNLYSGNVKANEVYEVGFQRNNMMSGIYIVKLTTDRGHSYTKNVIVE